MTLPTVYFDHNATTPVRPEVLSGMLPYLKRYFGNPNSAYRLGQETRRAVEKARAQVSSLIGAQYPDEIVFTSCGSESDAFAIQGAAVKKHLITSRIEHDAVLESFKLLEARGFEVDYVGVDRYGRVDPEEIRRFLRPDTCLVSIMFANNEVGTLQPIHEIDRICREKGVLFHTDAVQAVGKIPISVRELGADLLSLSGHKLNAPKGIGALYIRRGVRLSPLVTGHQEKERRGGTENVAGIVALGTACALAQNEMQKHSVEFLRLRKHLEVGILKLPGVRLNGHPDLRLPNTAHFSFEGVDGHALVVGLDLEGICVSSGPACSTGSVDPSHVLRAMGIAPALAKGSLRFSVGWGNSMEEVERFLEVFPKILEKQRRVLSPRS
ncbi:MAG: aminotransferase class V-fold PLP-dependent enzyme [Elusimicrobia bacterium]|nr:aminotransferase class V-fold PLP-dependent enzyme [Elusimicrobiota bacterium]